MTCWRSRKESWDVSSHLSCAPALRCHQLRQRCKTSLFLTRNICFNVFWRAPSRVLWRDRIRNVTQSCIMTSRDGPPNSFKMYFLQKDNTVLHTCHIWYHRTAGATTHFQILFATHQQVVNKVMIEHNSNEIFTFFTHVGDAISTLATPAGLRFHYSIAKCQYYIIPVSFLRVVLGTLWNETVITKYWHFAIA